jgi:hypothetical protein
MTLWLYDSSLRKLARSGNAMAEYAAQNALQRSAEPALAPAAAQIIAKGD